MSSHITNSNYKGGKGIKLVGQINQNCFSENCGNFKNCDMLSFQKIDLQANEKVSTLHHRTKTLKA
jgi:hypothetical protein